MKEASNLRVTERRHWHRIVRPNDWYGSDANAWCRKQPSEGSFYLITRPDFNTPHNVIDCYYFSLEKDAMLFALRWAA